MRSPLPLLLLALALVANSRSCRATRAEDPMEVDTGEVTRRGEHVQHVGGPIAGDSWQDDFSEAMAPPADDNHKWFLTVVTTSGCPACAKLHGEWDANPKLRALVNQSNHKQSWAHFQEIGIEDKSQAWRWKNVQFKAYPTIIIQPPLNGRFGDSRTVVTQIVYDGDSQKLANKIRDGIKKYLQARAQPPRNAAAAPRSDSQKAAGGHRARPTAEQDAYRGGDFVDRALALDEAQRQGQGAQEIGQVDREAAPPWTPAPKDPPVVQPGPPSSNPVFPWDDAAPAAEQESLPQRPMMFVVVDDDDLEAQDKITAPVRADLAAAGKETKRLKWSSAKTLFADLKRDDLPAIVAAEGGKVSGRLPGHLLKLFSPEAALAADPARGERLKKLIDSIGPLAIELLALYSGHPIAIPAPAVVAPAPVPAPAPAATPAPSDPPAPAPTPAPTIEIPAPLVNVDAKPDLTALVNLVDTWLTGGASVSAVLATAAVGLKMLRARRQATGKPQVLTGPQFQALVAALGSGDIATLMASLGSELKARGENHAAAMAVVQAAVQSPNPAPPAETAAAT